MKFKLLMFLAVLLVSFGLTQAQTNDSVYIELYNATLDIVHTSGDAIYMSDAGGNPYDFQLRMYIENSYALGGAQLGLVFSADAALSINWATQAGGYGFGGVDLGCACVTVPDGSRFDPTSSGSWDASGLLVNEDAIDQEAPDSILIGGASFNNNLAVGPKENMFNFHFTLDAPDENPRVLTIDSSQIGPGGDFIFSNTVGSTAPPNIDDALFFTFIKTNPSDADGNGPQVPVTFGLEQNSPNPFNPSTRLEYSVGQKGMVNITIYNILGQNVKTLVNEEKSADIYEVVWDGDDNSGAQVASGIYFYKMTTKGFIETKKMVLMR